MSSSIEKDFRHEIERIKRISDQMCSMHSKLRDIFLRKALILDCCIIIASIWLVSMVFIEPAIGKKLSPPGIDTDIWLGLLAIITFLLSILQFKVDWKKASQGHNKSVDFYASVKRECTYILTKYDLISLENCRHLIDRYDSSNEICLPIPENRFLSLKKYHKKKVFISKYIDKNPSVSIFLLKIRLWWRSNKMTKKNLATDSNNQNDKQ